MFANFLDILEFLYLSCNVSLLLLDNAATTVITVHVIIKCDLLMTLVGIPDKTSGGISCVTCIYRIYVVWLFVTVNPNALCPVKGYTYLKVVSAIFLIVLFCMSKREQSWSKEKCFLFHFESSFCSWDNQVLTFPILKCHDVIRCLSMKHETHFTE